MKRLLLFFFITFLPKVLFAQLVTVQDSSSKAVLPGVSVYNKSHSTFTQTDLKGTFDSGLFDDKDLIIFRLMGYELLSISKRNIQSDTIYLTPKVEGLNEIVVSASKFRQDIRKLPVRVRRIDADDISDDTATNYRRLTFTNGFCLRSEKSTRRRESYDSRFCYQQGINYCRWHSNE